MLLVTKLRDLECQRTKELGLIRVEDFITVGVIARSTLLSAKLLHTGENSSVYLIYLWGCTE